MTTDVVSATLRPGLARPPLRDRLKLEHVVMGGAIVALIVLVVLPLLSLLFGSVKGEQGLSLDHFSEVLSGRLYVTALKNSLILGAWTEPVQPGHRPAAGLGGEPHRRAGQAADSAHRHALLSVAAVPHRDRADLSVQPECRADQRADARRRRPSLAHLQHLLHAGAGAGDGACTRSRSSICWPRARSSRSMPPTRRRRRFSAPASCAPRSRSRRRWWRPRSCRARCSPSSTRSPCSARRRSSGCPPASSRCRPASTRCSTIRRNTGWPRRCRWCSCSSPWSRSTSSARSWRGAPT